MIFDEHLMLLSTMLESIPGPVFYKDVTRTYLGCNQAFCDFVGLPKEKIIGHAAEDFCDPELAAAYREADEKLLANPGPQVYESAVRYADGSLHDVIFHKATYEDCNGNVAGLIGIILDISQRKLTEMRLRAQLLERSLDAIKAGSLRVDLV